MEQGRPVPRAPEPPLKVVGFHVEGASPSPARPGGLRDVAGGSPSPVIIPPSFQAQASRPADTPSAHPAPGSTSGAAGLPPLRTTGAGDRPEAATGARTPMPVGSSSSPKAPPRPRVSGSAPAHLTSLDSAATSPPQQPTSAKAKAEAALPSDQAEKGAEPGAGQLAPAAQAQTPPPPLPPQQQQQQQAEQDQRPGGRPQQKQMTKAERRALQEAQRAVKAGKGPREADTAPKLTKSSSSSSLSRQQSSVGAAAAASDARAARSRGSTRSVEAGSAGGTGAAPAAPPVSKPTELFAHLQQYNRVSVQSAAERGAAAGVPPDCIRLGLQMADGSVRGANTRCCAMLEVFLSSIRDFKTPPGRSFPKEYGSALNTMVSFLVSCRPLSPSMGNAVKHVKVAVDRLKLAVDLGDGEAKAELAGEVNTYLHEKVRFARDVLARHAAPRFADGDVVLTYGYSTTVEAVLLAALASGRRLSVVVADARPLLEGRRMLRRLLAAGVPCEYVHINGLDIGLSHATKVVLGAAAVLSNGAVISRVGTAAVAMAAAAAHVPVLVCAETHKFHERVQLDSITHNELGDPQALVAVSAGEAGAAALAAWQPHDNLSLLNLMYDATPPEFVTVVVTELGALPPTSVPVVLREYRREMMTAA